MKKLFYKFIYMSFPLWLAIVVLFVLLIKVDYNSKIPQTRPCISKPQFDFEYHLAQIDWSKLDIDFPYKEYLDSANWCDIKAVIQDVEEIGNFYQEEGPKGLLIIIEALTKRLEKRYELRHTYYNPDGLIEILQWATSFKQSSDDYNTNKIQRIITRFWFNYVSGKLSLFAKQKSSLKYDFKFRYLVGLCNSHQFSPSIGNSKFEKVVLNFIDTNFCYMFNRFWHSTGLVFKLIVALVILLQLYAYWCVIIVHFRTKKIQLTKTNNIL